MSSTDLEAPSRKLLLAAIIIVVGLHVLTAIALAAVKTPELKVDKKETPTIEIELISLPPEITEPEVEVVEVVPKQEPKPQEKPKPQIKEQQLPKPQPVVQPKPKAPVKPVVTEKKITPKAAPIAPVKEQKTVERPKELPKETLVKPKVDTSVADEQRKIIAAQAKAAQEAQAVREAQAQATREAQAAANAKAVKEEAESAARAQAAKEAEAAALAKAQAAKEAAAAASNTPVNFTASAANWASTPNFSFPDRAARKANSGDVLEVVLVLRVNKQGGIDSVSVAKSSGNTMLDKEAQRQVRSGKFKPFTKNGTPVVGNVTLPIAYKVP